MPRVPKATHIQTFLLLTALAALLSAALLYRIPPDPDNIWLLGLSPRRFGLLSGLIALALGSLSAALYVRKSPRPLERGLDTLLGCERLYPLLFGAGAGLFLSAAFTLNAYTTTNRLAQPFLRLLTPLSVLFGLLCAALLVFLPLWGRQAWQTRQHSASWPRWRLALAALLVLAAAWFPRVIALDRFVTPDEPTWLAHAANFYLALNRRDFAATYQLEHPGVLPMWLAAAAFRWKFPAILQEISDPIGPGKLELLFVKYSFRKTDLLAAARYLMVTANVAAITLTFLFAQRLLGLTPALLGGLLLALDPFHVAHTRLLQLDGLLSSLMTLSLLAYLNFRRTRRVFDLLTSGLIAGLAWLTKTPGFFLIPIVGLLALWEAVAAARRSLPLPKNLRQTVLPLLLWGLAAAGLFVLLFPAMWVQPLGTLAKMFSATLGYAAQGHRGPVFFAGKVFADGIIATSNLRFYPTTYLWRTTPVVLAGLVLAAASLLARKNPAPRDALAGLAFFALSFYLLQNMGAKKFDRYLLAVYPSLDLLAGTGLAFLAAILPKPRLSAAFLAALLGLQLLPVLQTAPYYLSYYNPLMGGAAKAPQSMMIGWGEGLDQAARYLNAKPNAEKLNVIAWYNQGSFSYFFKGDSQHIPINQQPSPKRLQEIMQMDYAVIYIHQWQRRTPENLLTLLERRQPEHTIWIDGLEYVRIYRLDGGQ